MARNNTVESRIKISADEGSIANTQRKIEALENNLTRLANETDNFTNVTKEQQRQIDTTSAALRGYQKAVDGLAKSGDAAKVDIDALNTSLEKANGTLKDIRTARYDEAFNKVSREVSSFGDAESSFNAARGLADAVGVDTGGLQVASEAFAAAEAFPRLRVALQQVGETVANGTGLAGKLATSLQTVVPGLTAANAGMVLLGAGLGIVVALVAAVTFAQQQYQKALEDFKTVIEQQSKYFDLIQDSTSADLQQQRTEIERQVEARRQELELREQQLRQLQDETGVLGDVFENISKGPLQFIGGQGAAAFDAARGAVSSTRDELERLEAELANVDKALESESVAANDAAAATLQATQELIAFAQQQVDSYTKQFQLLRQSTEQIDGYTQGLEDQRLAIALAKQELINSGDTSQEVADQIAAFNDQLYDIQDALDFAVAARRAAEVREAAEKAAEEQKQIQDELVEATRKYNDDVSTLQKESLQKQADLQREYAENVVKIAEKRAEDERKALEKLTEAQDKIAKDRQRSERDALIELGRDQLDLEIEAQRDREKAARDHAKELRDIQKEADKQSRELAQEGNFRELFNLRRTTAERITESEQAFSEQQADTQQELDKQRNDLLVALQREREDRERSYADQLADAQQAYQQQLQQARDNEQQQLAQLAVKYQQEQALLQQSAAQQLADLQASITRQLQTAQQSFALREAVEAAAYQRLLSQAQSILSGGLNTGSPYNSSANGGINTYSSGSSFNSTNNTMTVNNGITINEARRPGATGQEVSNSIVTVLGRVIDR